MDELQKYENDLLDDDLGHTESKINPDTWGFEAIRKAIEVMGESGNFETNVLRVTSLVSMAEAVAKGQNRIGKEYQKEMEKLRNSEEYKGLKTLNQKLLKESVKKIELISRAIGMNETITSPMAMNKK